MQGFVEHPDANRAAKRHRDACLPVEMLADTHTFNHTIMTSQFDAKTVGMAIEKAGACHGAPFVSRQPADLSKLIHQREVLQKLLLQQAALNHEIQKAVKELLHCQEQCMMQPQTNVHSHGELSGGSKGSKGPAHVADGGSGGQPWGGPNSDNSPHSSEQDLLCHHAHRSSAGRISTPKSPNRGIPRVNSGSAEFPTSNMGGGGGGAGAVPREGPHGSNSMTSDELMATLQQVTNAGMVSERLYVRDPKQESAKVAVAGAVAGAPQPAGKQMQYNQQQVAPQQQMAPQQAPPQQQMQGYGSGNGEQVPQGQAHPQFNHHQQQQQMAPPVHMQQQYPGGPPPNFQGAQQQPQHFNNNLHNNNPQLAQQQQQHRQPSPFMNHTPPGMQGGGGGQFNPANNQMQQQQLPGAMMPPAPMDARTKQFYAARAHQQQMAMQQQQQQQQRGGPPMRQQGNNSMVHQNINNGTMQMQGFPPNPQQQHQHQQQQAGQQRTNQPQQGNGNGGLVVPSPQNIAYTGLEPAAELQNIHLSPEEFDAVLAAFETPGL